MTVNELEQRFTQNPAKLIITELDALDNLKSTGAQIVLQFWPTTIRESRSVKYDNTEGIFQTSEPSFTSVNARQFTFSAFCQDNAYPEYGSGYTAFVLEALRQFSEVGVRRGDSERFTDRANNASVRQLGALGLQETRPEFFFDGAELEETQPRPLLVQAHDGFIGYLKSYNFNIITVDKDVVPTPTSATIDLTFVEALTRQRQNVIGNQQAFVYDGKTYVRL